MTGFRWVRFHGGPHDGRRERIKTPLPDRLLMPVSSGRARTWGTDETRLVGVARYELQAGRTRYYYAIVKSEDDERGDQA
jgi:hypothetical protein